MLGKYDDVDYWGMRQANNMYKDMEDAETVALALGDIYRRAAGYISEGIDKIYDKFKDNNKLSNAQALHMLENINPNATIRDNVREIQNRALDEGELFHTAKLEAPAYRYRIQRLEEKLQQIDEVMQQVYDKEKEITTSHYEQEAEKAYTREIYDTQHRAGIGFSFEEVDQDQIDKVLKMDWSGKNYSGRIWGNTQELAEELKKELIANLITGRTEKETTKVIEDKFFKGYKNAKRLIRTESAWVSNELQALAYEEMEITKYMYVATLDLRTSEICRSLDSKVFEVKDRKTGKNFPPMHPWCRSTTIAYLDDENMKTMQRRVKNEKDNNVLVDWMDYDEWYKKYGEKAGNKLASYQNNDKMKLTDDEEYAINKYTGFDSYIINEKLRKGIKLTEKEKTITRNLDKALKKISKYEGNLQRSLQFKDNVDVNEFLKEYKIDGKITYKEYISTTKGETYNPDGQVQIYIQNSKKGMDISLYNNQENEVIYKRGSTFKVLNMIENNGIHYILMEEF